MAASIEEPLIIEFNGLPGSGKSSIAQRVVMELEAEGIRCLRLYNRTKLYRHHRFSLLRPYCLKLYHVLTQYSGLLCPQSRKYAKLSAAYYLRMYVDFLKDKPASVLVVDQGILQAFLSLGYTDVMPDSVFLREAYEIIKRVSHNMMVVNCSCPEDETMARIRGRKPNGARVHTMDEKELQDTLHTQTRNLDLLRTLSKSILNSGLFVELNTLDTIENNVGVIYHQVKNL